MFRWLFRKPPTIPERFAAEDAHYFLDGGTIELIGTDQAGRRRLVRLTQHMFAQWGGVGWLYLDCYRVPRRGDTERAIVRVLRRSLDELQQRSQGRLPGERTIAEAPAGTGAVVIASDDVAEMARMTAAERRIRLVTDVLAYVESDRYGQVTG